MKTATDTNKKPTILKVDKSLDKIPQEKSI
jgi:hypothetical protein